MNLDPSMTQSRPESRFTNIAIRFGLAAMAIAGCSNDSNDHDGTAVLKVSPESVLACDVQPFNPYEYKKAMGMGPYAENTEADALKLDSKKVIAEFVNEIPKNTMGTALFSEMLKQQNGQYEIPSIIKGATDSFDVLFHNDDKRKSTCQDVRETVLTKGEIFDITSGKVVEVKNVYDTYGNLVSLETQIVDVKSPIKVITVRDKNNAVSYGVVISKERDGRFVIVVNQGQQNGTKNSTPGSTPDTSKSTEQSTPANGTTPSAGTVGGGGNGGGGDAPTSPSTPDKPGTPDTTGTPTDVPGTTPNTGPGTSTPNTVPGTTTPNTTTTTIPKTTTTTTIPSTTTTAKPKGVEPPADCINNPNDPRC